MEIFLNDLKVCFPGTPPRESALMKYSQTSPAAGPPFPAPPAGRRGEMLLDPSPLPRRASTQDPPRFPQGIWEGGSWLSGRRNCNPSHSKSIQQESHKKLLSREELVLQPPLPPLHDPSLNPGTLDIIGSQSRAGAWSATAAQINIFTTAVGIKMCSAPEKNTKSWNH